MHGVLEVVVLVALALTIGTALLLVIRESRGGRTGDASGGSHNDADLQEAVSRRVASVPDGGNASKAWDPSWDPFRHRHARRLDDPVTYRAGPPASGERPPAWDPHAHDQSRAHRVRQARHKIFAATMPDYYKLLGIERGATDAQIERAYKRRASTLHPDKFYDDVERRAQAESALKELNLAMQVLRDPTRRAQYDAKL
ncbi:MAG: hypothetical protein NVS2B16_21320 [Chloroflexota bacterium]